MQSAVSLNPGLPEPRIDFLQALAARALAVLRADGVAIALNHGDAIVCEASLGAAPQVGARLDATSTLSVRCLQTARPVSYSRAADSRGAAYSVVLVPIVEAGQSIGLCATFADRENAFTAGQVEALAEIAAAVVEQRTSKVVTFPAPATDAASPLTSFNASMLKQVEEEIATFARQEKRRDRVAVATKVGVVALLMCIAGALLAPDRVSAWVAPILQKIERATDHQKKQPPPLPDRTHR